jgi:hypothetical protein
MAWPKGKKRAGHRPPQVGPPRTAAAGTGHPFTFVPLPEVPEHRSRGVRAPLAIALLEGFEKKLAVKVELRGKTLSTITGSATSSMKALGYRVRSRTVDDVGYIWLEKIEEK